jgi:nucleoside-triphosphatase THEP1
MKIELGKINLITGERGVGKTILCSTLIEKMKIKEYSVAGIISPGLYHNDVKVGIKAINIKSGENVKLADYSPGWDTENPLRIWKMNSDAISWGNDVLNNSIPCDVLIIDEIGYLEFEKNSGWNNSFKILREKEFKIAFIVVRIDLMGAALSYWEKAQILKIENGENVGLISNKILHQIEINATK